MSGWCELLYPAKMIIVHLMSFELDFIRPVELAFRRLTISKGMAQAELTRPTHVQFDLHPTEFTSLAAERYVIIIMALQRRGIPTATDSTNIKLYLRRIHERFVTLSISGRVCRYCSVILKMGCAAMCDTGCLEAGVL